MLDSVEQVSEQRCHAHRTVDLGPAPPARIRDRHHRVPQCGGRIRVIADIADPNLIQRILEHLRGQPPPRAGPARTERAPSDNDLLASA